MKVSVCIATFNGEKYIKKQIESILSQLSSNDEIIISDDGSIDSTIEIIERLNDSRIKIFNNKCLRRDRKSMLERFKLVTKNFENALKNASGDYIFLSDQDDLWDKDKIKIMLQYLPECDLVVSDYGLIDENDDPISLKLFKRKKTQGFFSNLLVTPYIGCGMAFSKAVLANSLPFPKNLFAHDLWIGFVAQYTGKVLFIDEKLFYHRRHGQNVSYSFEKSKNSLFFKINYRLVFLYMIVIRYIQLTFRSNK